MSVPTVSAAEAQARLDAGAVLIDVREDHEWAQAHVPVARHLPLSRFMAHLPDIPDDRPVLVLCAHGNRSHQVTGWLCAQGYDAWNVAGGIESWAASGLPVEP